MVRNWSASADEPELDHAARGIERDAAAPSSARRYATATRDDEGQLLRLRAAGVVDDAAVGGGERAREALASPATPTCSAKRGIRSL